MDRFTNFLRACVFVLPVFAFGQDVVKFKNGIDLKVKVQEINPKEIKYKRFDNLDGPLIVVEKSEINTIIYQNGVVDYFTTAPVTELPVTNSVSPIASPAPSAAMNYQVGDLVEIVHFDKPYVGKIIRVLARERVKVEVTQNGNTSVFDRSFATIKPVQSLVSSPSAPVSIVLAQPIAASVARLPSGQLSYSTLFQQGENDAKLYYRGYKGAGTATFLTTFLLPILGLVPAIACSSSPPRGDKLGMPNLNFAQENPDYFRGYNQQAKRIKSRKVWGNFGIAVGINVAIILIAGNIR